MKITKIEKKKKTLSRRDRPERESLCYRRHRRQVHVNKRKDTK